MAFRSVPRPSSPPGAKASTECPCFARSRIVMRRSDPCPRTHATQTNSAHSSSLNVDEGSLPPPRVARRRPLSGTDAPVRRDRDAQPRPETQPEPYSRLQRTSLRSWKQHGARSSDVMPFCDRRARPGSARTRRRAEPFGIPTPEERVPRASPRRSAGRSPALLAGGAAGGDDRDRTGDPLLAKQVLSQLSYAPRGTARTPSVWAREDLNLRPHAYQACALTS